MFTKIVYFFLVGLISLHLFTPSQVIATPSNVMDCMEEGVNCEELNDIQESDFNSQNDEDFLIESNQGGSLLLDMVKLFFALVLVVALIYIVLKLLNNKNKLTTQGKVLQNVVGLSLGQNKSLQIVRIGSKFYLVGVGENVQLLDEISDEEIIEELMNNENTAQGSNSNTFIASLIPSSFNQKNKKDFNELFSNELEKLKQNRKDLIKKQKEDKHD